MFVDSENTQVDIGPLHMNEDLESIPQTELIFSPLTCALALLTLEFPIEVNDLVIYPVTPLEI